MKRSAFGTNKRLTLWQSMRPNMNLYIMLIPGLTFILIFCYLPMAGLAIAFKDFKIFSGFNASPWVGFDNFKQLFAAPSFYEVMRNTIVISFYKIVFGFPIPILIALMVNEMRVR